MPATTIGVEELDIAAGALGPSARFRLLPQHRTVPEIPLAHV